MMYISFYAFPFRSWVSFHIVTLLSKSTLSIHAQGQYSLYNRLHTHNAGASILLEYISIRVSVVMLPFISLVSLLFIYNSS